MPSLNPSYVWIAFIGMMVVTFGVRLSVIALLKPDAELPLNVRRALRYVPPAVLTAIITPQVVMPGGTLDLNPLGNVRIIAAAVATLVAWKTHNTLLTIAAGMVVLWGLMALV